MGRKQPVAPARVDPARAALTRIADLVARGADAARLRRTVEDIVDGWSGVDRDEVRDRLETMREQLGEGLEAATEQVADLAAEKAPELKVAERSLAALRAAHDAVRVPA